MNLSMNILVFLGAQSRDEQKNHNSKCMQVTHRDYNETKIVIDHADWMTQEASNYRLHLFDQKHLVTICLQHFCIFSFHLCKLLYQLLIMFYKFDTFLKKNGPLFSFIFGLFIQTLQNFTTNKCEKMYIQYTVSGFEPTTCGRRVSSHNH